MSKNGANHHSQRTDNGTEGLGHKKKAGKSRKGSWCNPIHKVLKKNQKNTTISQRAMAVMESFTQDMFDRLSAEASKLAAQNDSEVITARDFEAAVRTILPKNLGDYAAHEGQSALDSFVQEASYQGDLSFGQKTSQ